MRRMFSIIVRVCLEAVGEIQTHSDSEWEGEDLEEEQDQDIATQFSHASDANSQAPPRRQRNNPSANVCKSQINELTNHSVTKPS